MRREFAFAQKVPSQFLRDIIPFSLSQETLLAKSLKPGKGFSVDARLATHGRKMPSTSSIDSAVFVESYPKMGWDTDLPNEWLGK